MNEWQPIETAPEGEEVIVYTPFDGVVSSKWEYGCWQKLTTVIGHGQGNEPTHWQPLPEPPK